MARRLAAERTDVLVHLGAVRARLLSALTEPLLLSRGVQAHLVDRGGLQDAEFVRLAAAMLADYPTVRNLTFARRTIIAAVYPVEGNRSVIGVDYRDRPDQWPTVEQAIATKRPALAGPVPLIQGGTALIGRIPVFLPVADGGDGQFYGLLSVVIDLDKVFAAAGLLTNEIPVSIAIRGRDGKGAMGAMIHGDEAVFESRPLEMDVVLPGGIWRLGGIPKGGWGAPDSGLPMNRLVNGLLALGLAASAFGIAYYVVSQDRTRLAAEESEQRYKVLVEMAPVAVWVHRDGKVILANDAGRLMVGAPAGAETRGLDLLALVHPADRGAAESRVARLMSERGRAPPVELRVTTLDGRNIDILSVSSSVTIDGAPAVMSVVSDITERRKTEAERDGLVRRLQRSNEDLQQFAYIASHDLQEPLRNIAGYVQLLGRRYRGRLDHDADQFIDFAVNGTIAMGEMISDLLDYSKLGGDEGTSAPFESRRALDRALADLAPQIKDCGATVNVGWLPTVQGSEFGLIRIFRNLLGNALKYRKPDQPPVIRVTAAHKGDEWVFGVSDNGIGIGEDYREKIFAIFQRLHGRDAYEGTGIGLAVCRKLVERAGGRIWVESREGKGSTFYFTVKGPA